MELEAERISPTLTSRYMNNYITNPTPDIYHQNYHSPRQNMQSFYPMMENDRNYLKRHYYTKEEADVEDRDRKYEKLMEQGHYAQSYQTNEQIYDTYNNNTLYPENTQDDNRNTAVQTEIMTPSNNSNDNYPNNSSPASSAEEASDRVDSPKSVVSGKKTKGRVKIKMEYIENKLRRYTTFSKRKTGIMKKVSKFNFQFSLECLPYILHLKIIYQTFDFAIS
jgi:hypothetical protein